MEQLKEFMGSFISDMGIMQFFNTDTGYLNLIMILLSMLLLYLAIVKKYEPLLLLPIAFGMLLTNLPGAELFHSELWTLSEEQTHVDIVHVLENGGLLDLLYIGVKLGIYPPLIFLGVGAMTDFGPLIANPKSLLLGAAAQLGIFIAFFGALAIGFLPEEAAAIGIIGGADGPTAIYSASKLAPRLLGPIAVAAYSYMALVPIIQPPIMKALTTKKERLIVMEQLRPVSKKEKIIFPIAVTIVVALILPSAAPLIGMLMLGNLFRESGVVERLNKTAQNELNNIVVIFLGVTVGATATGPTFLDFIPKMAASDSFASAMQALFNSPIGILGMGLIAFCFGTAGGVLLAKLMNVLSGGKINPLIGSAGVSAVPMAARVTQTVGAEENPHNFLLMHAMGPNVAGVIGSAVAAGVFLSMLAG
ncbi:MAG: sodium ion-translocating decarboxylase subunit beta [Clostridia bacterium]|nr:sodium ion-translocating decarboxylase subunit beta [Clostridia bacterium]